MSTGWWVLLNVALFIAGIWLGFKAGRVDQVLSGGVNKVADSADVNDVAEMAIDGEPKTIHFRGGVDDGWFMP